MTRLFRFLLFSLLLTRVGAATEPSLLPDHFGNWQASGPAKATLGKISALASLDTKDAEAKEAGLRATEQRDYKNGSDELNVFLLKFQDPSGAYQFYTRLLQPGRKTLPLGEESSLSDQDGIFLVGNLVFTAAASSQLKVDSLADLFADLKAKADPTPFPPLKTYLPEKGLVSGTQRYALGPSGFRSAMAALEQGNYTDLAKDVGFQSGVESMLARYKSDRDTGVLLLLEYPTPQLAEQHLHHLEEALPAEARQAGVDIERKGSLLSLVFGAKSKEFVRDLRKEVNYETKVTWNEPHQTLTDPSWVDVMAKIFLFTGLFLGVALGLGVAFGGVRVLTKRFFPGKVFDRPQDVEVLQMGLSGKKIDPSDLY